MPTLPPGPSLPPIAQTYRYLHEPFAFLDECAERYGDKFTLRFFRVPPFVNRTTVFAWRRMLSASR